MDELRTRVGQQLLEAADDGRLEEALSKKVGDQRLSGGARGGGHREVKLCLDVSKFGQVPCLPEGPDVSGERMISSAYYGVTHVFHEPQ